MITVAFASPAARPAGFLRRLNPLAKIAAVLPAMISLFLVRGTGIPLVFGVIALVLLVAGARLPARLTVLVLLGAPLMTLALSLGFSVWVDPARIDQGAVLLTVGEWRFTTGMWLIGFGTALRIVAMTCLALVPGLTTVGADLAHAMIQQLHVPYRVGYAVLTAFTFPPRLRREAWSVRAAYRVRGRVAGRGYAGRVQEAARLPVPVLTGAIRHAERVALTMDSRGFGAHRTRTERHPIRLHATGVVFAVAGWAVTAGILMFV
ncbi:MAG: energy-coupling factor transporter transmembrane component T [Microbacterium sp.]